MKLVNDIVYAVIGCFSPSVDVGVTKAITLLDSGVGFLRITIETSCYVSTTTEPSRGPGLTFPGKASAQCWIKISNNDTTRLKAWVPISVDPNILSSISAL